ncbi:NB-ARC domain-containing protein [Roseibium sp.]|uniref:NB-ARC domain-containing protein n=1 Tax=Roseibium sp. TaxID=1936156 RepID=UPI003BABAD63
MSSKWIQHAILDSNGIPVGSGILIDDRHILTCAHVLNAAMGRALETTAIPSGEYEFTCRRIPWSESALQIAKLIDGSWRPLTAPHGTSIKDMAILKLSDPDDQTSVSIYPGRHFDRGDIDFFGFPKEHPDGVTTTIRLSGPLGDSWYQADNSPGSEQRVRPGFSGSPILDKPSGLKAGQRLLGYLSCTDQGDARSGFFIPGFLILDYLEELGFDRNMFASLGPLNNPIPLPTVLETREVLLDQLTSNLVRESGQVGLLGLHGIGGVGKSVIASLASRHELIRQHFHDGIYGITIGQDRTSNDLAALQIDLAAALGVSADGSVSLTDRCARISAALSDRQILFIIDDVWDRFAVDAFNIQAPNCSVLFTSRRASCFEHEGIKTQLVDLLDEGEAEALFRHRSGIRSDTPLDEIQQAILRHCGCHALAIVIAASMVKKHPSRQALILDRFRKSNVQSLIADIPEYRRSDQYPTQETSIYSIVNASYEFLSSEDQLLLKCFTIFPEDVAVPISVIELFSAFLKQDELEIDLALDRLSDLGLINRRKASGIADDSGFVDLHDIQLDFVRSLDGDISEIAESLVAAWSEKEGTRFYDPDDQGENNYLRLHGPLHLKQSGRETEVLELLNDPLWIALKLRLDGVHNLISIYDQALHDI